MKHCNIFQFPFLSKLAADFLDFSYRHRLISFILKPQHLCIYTKLLWIEITKRDVKIKIIFALYFPSTYKHV
jgi:hypothetical protein